MRLTILNVAYPFAPVSPDAVGGAEQIISTIDRHLVAAGHRSIVVACEGSIVAGELLATPAPDRPLDFQARYEATVRHQHMVARALARWDIDVVHVHGHDFDGYLPPPGVPVLATIHLPPELLLARLSTLDRPCTWVHGVSAAQHARLPGTHVLLPPIENGVDVDGLPRQVSRQRFALALGRVCPEKGFHLAMDAAARARLPILVGGMVFPYDDHERYFDRELLPRISRASRFLGRVSLCRKRRLLSAARCLVVPSLAQETSSLAAMEALACGTPVVAFPAGALPGIVDDGVTGFIVHDVDEMADAMLRAGSLDPDACRAAARERFSAARMVGSYIERYERIVSWSRTPTRASQAFTSSA